MRACFCIALDTQMKHGGVKAKCFLLPRYQRPFNTQHCIYMSLQKLGNERYTHYDCKIVRKAFIFTVKSSAPAA